MNLVITVYLLFSLLNCRSIMVHAKCKEICPETLRLTKTETGLEFLESHDINLKLDNEFFFGIELFNVQQRDDLSPLELVQMFVRNIKGFPVYKNMLGNKENDNITLDWCYKPYELKELVKAELKIYQILKEFRTEEQLSSFSALDGYLRDIEESSLRAIQIYDSSNEMDDVYLYIASHPLLVYRLVRRFAEDLHPILSQLNLHTDESNLLHRISKYGSSLLPNSRDHRDALEALSRIQHGTDLDTYQMAKGQLETVQTGISLNALHCLELGAFHLVQGDYDYAIQWLDLALKTAQKSPALQRFPEIEEFFTGLVRKAVDQHNLQFVKQYSDLWHPSVFNTSVSLPFRPELYQRRIHQLQSLATEQMNNVQWNWAMKFNFNRVCSGKNLQSDAEKAFLKCWYFKPENTYWQINPLKTELLSFYPQVYHIYDFIGDNLTEKIKSNAVTYLQRSAVVDPKHPSKSQVSSTRTSSQTWFNDQNEENKYLIPLTKKLEQLTGLVIKKSSASDNYQVASYGPSHHYEPHLDSFEDARRAIEKGNRITTIMGYLSDVKAGGRTGFPVLGISAEPIKGSIVIWDNLKRNGVDREERSWHGGCPVVLGVKWITNKWVYYKENMFTFQCTLDPRE